MNDEYGHLLAGLSPIGTGNARESELAAIAAARESHPEWLAMARTYDMPEIRRTVSDVEMVEDKDLRQSLLKSLLLAIAGDPGSAARLANGYMARILADTDHVQADFWLARMKEGMK